MLPAASHEATQVASPLTASARSGVGTAGLVSGVVFLVFLIDAMRRPPGTLDVESMRAIQRFDLPYLNAFLERLDLLTDSAGAVAAWGLACVVCFAARRWLPLLGFLTLPTAGLINEGVGIFLVTRVRPHLDVLTRRSENWEERSFPSGHVVGVVLLYGFLWFLAGRLRSSHLRMAVRLVCGAIIFLTGFDRVWGGAHWPSDVVAAYALGTALLCALILAYRYAETHLGPYLAPRWGLTMARAARSSGCARARPALVRLGRCRTDEGRFPDS